MDMTHEDLNSIGVTAFGHRHKIFKKIKEMSHTGGSTGTVRMEGGSGGKREGGGGSLLQPLCFGVLFVVRPLHVHVHLYVFLFYVPPLPSPNFSSLS